MKHCVFKVSTLLSFFLLAHLAEAGEGKSLCEDEAISFATTVIKETDPTVVSVVFDQKSHEGPNISSSQYEPFIVFMLSGHVVLSTQTQRQFELYLGLRANQTDMCKPFRLNNGDYLRGFYPNIEWK